MSVPRHVVEAGRRENIARRAGNAPLDQHIAAAKEPAGVTLILPEPPSANRYWRIYRGRAVKSAAAREYREIVKVKWDASGPDGYSGHVHTPFTGDVVVTIHWYRARKSGDLDNRAKVVLDAVKGLLYVDDKQVVALHLYRHESPRAGSLTITCAEAP